jgi:hypothetical protein
MRQAILIGFLLSYFLSAGSVRSQTLPKGFSIQEGTSGKNQLFGDFDGDNRGDALAVIEGGGQTLVYIATAKCSFKSKDAPRCCSYIERSKNVIVLHSTGMRGFYTWRFRYNTAFKNFQLIGMDTESFGNAVHDGSGTSSLNLLTGDFEAKYNSWNEKRQKLIALPAIKKKLKIGRRIFITDFGDESDDYLFNLTYKYLPKEAQ